MSGWGNRWSGWKSHKAIFHRQRRTAVLRAAACRAWPFGEEKLSRSTKVLLVCWGNSHVPLFFPSGSDFHIALHCKSYLLFFVKSNLNQLHPVSVLKWRMRLITSQLILKLRKAPVCGEMLLSQWIVAAELGVPCCHSSLFWPRTGSALSTPKFGELEKFSVPSSSLPHTVLPLCSPWRTWRAHLYKANISMWN